MRTKPAPLPPLVEDPDRLLEVILIGQPSVLVEEVCEELCFSGITGLELYILHHFTRYVWFLESASQWHVCQDSNWVGFEIGT